MYRVKRPYGWELKFDLVGKDYAISLIPRLEQLRYGYRDEIPSETVHSTSPDPYYKCRIAWFGCVRGFTGAMVEKEVASEELLVRRREFYDSFDEVVNANDGLTSPEQIAQANHLLDLAFASIDDVLKSE